MTNKEIESAQNALRSVRYGVSWEGDPKIPIHKEMPDGYWVPWHVADLLLAGLNNDKSIMLLKQLEWSGIYSYCTGWSCCPVCKGIQPGHGMDKDGELPTNSGHYKNCKLFDAIND